MKEKEEENKLRKKEPTNKKQAFKILNVVLQVDGFVMEVFKSEEFFQHVRRWFKVLRKKRNVEKNKMKKLRRKITKKMLEKLFGLIGGRGQKWRK